MRFISFSAQSKTAPWRWNDVHCLHSRRCSYGRSGIVRKIGLPERLAELSSALAEGEGQDGVQFEKIRKITATSHGHPYQEVQAASLRIKSTGAVQTAERIQK